jgi:hypothetical protein
MDNYLTNTKLSKILSSNYDKIKQDIYNKLNPYLDMEIILNENDSINILYKPKTRINIYAIINQLFSPIEMYINDNSILFSYYYLELNEYYLVNLTKN